MRGVEAGSPAARAGIQRGDLLVSVAGRPLAAVDDLFDALEAAAGGDGPLVLGIVRGTEEREASVAV